MSQVMPHLTLSKISKQKRLSPLQIGRLKRRSHFKTEKQKTTGTTVLTTYDIAQLVKLAIEEYYSEIKV